MGGQPIVFNYQGWVAAFPQFSAVSEPLAQTYFDMATLYFRNCGWQASLKQAPTLLNLLTTHIAWLYAPRDDNGNPASTGTFAPPIVGRISSASQGSVSMQTDFDSTKGSPRAQWYNSTPWGSAYFAATAQFRTARYVGVRRGVVNGVFPSVGSPYSSWIR